MFWRKKKKPKTKSVKLKENVEAVATAIALAMLIRLFALEAFMIPTGSMAPTLYGDHAEIHCPNCGAEFAVGAHGKMSEFEPAVVTQHRCPYCGAQGEFAVRPANDGSGAGEACCPVCGRCFTVDAYGAGSREAVWRLRTVCPVCGYEFCADLHRNDLSVGDRILVDKMAYLFRKPRRWEVVVFKWPMDTSKNYIKRLVGLPGETLEIRRGEIYANGRIARKPAWARRVVARPVWLMGRRRRSATVPWRAESGSWRFQSDRFSADASASADARAVLTLQPENRLPYNDREPALLVGDVTLKFRVRVRDASDGAAVQAELSEEAEYDGASGEFGVRRSASLNVGVGAGDCSIVVDGERRAGGGTFLSPGRWHEIEFSNVDMRAEVRVDGRLVARWDDDRSHDWSPEKVTVAVGIRGCRAEFTNVEVWRDIYYDPGGDCIRTVKVPEDGYWVMGDNTPNSNDSRSWGVVPADNMMGRALAVFWPLNRWHLIR